MCVRVYIHVYIYIQENTFQAILITDGTYSYTIFTYKCGFMQWDRYATIGIKADANYFINNHPSSNAVACLNFPKSNYSNIIFLLSVEDPELLPPGKCFYLQCLPVN